jgi:hypothetical protein
MSFQNPFLKFQVTMTFGILKYHDISKTDFEFTMALRNPYLKYHGTIAISKTEIKFTMAFLRNPFLIYQWYHDISNTDFEVTIGGGGGGGTP